MTHLLRFSAFRGHGVIPAIFSLVLSLAAGCYSGASLTPPADTGGAGGSGGTSATGGSVTSGGTSGSGGAMGSGGSSASGGRSGTGGTTVTGGSTAAGGGTTSGTTSSGGRSGVGGATGSGGAGGSPASGGTTGPGGRTGRDGGSATGGAAGSTALRDAAAGGGAAGTGGGTGSGGSGMSAGCGKTPTISSSQYNNGTTIPITVGSQQRRYVLNVPTNYDNTKPYKLVVTIHQLDGNDKQMYSWQYYGLLPLSNNTAIFAAPNGQKNGSPCSGTSSGDSGCGWPNTSGQDMALMDAVVKQVEDNFCVDTNRIFATGWSYGASMSYEVGCQRPLGGTGSATWGVRAIAIYSGRQMSGSCKPSSSTPVAFYESHGINDNVLSYDSGVGLAQNFANADGCTWATPAKASSSHICTNVAGCKAGYPVEFCSFVGSHTPFPDNGQSSGSWGPPEAWKFLSQF